MQEFLKMAFLDSGLGAAVIGSIACVMLGGIGSARGIRIAGAQGAGVLSEKPELFGKLLVLMALPGTQGFYGFIVGFMMWQGIGLTAGKIACTPLCGWALMFVGICAGMVMWWSGVRQGEASAAAISLTGKHPEEGGRAILLPALVETYAVVALLAAILVTQWLTRSGGLSFVPTEQLTKILQP